MSIRVCAILAAGALSVAASGPAAAQSVPDRLECLHGNWLLNDGGLEDALARAFKNSQSGTDFDLQGIDGAYYARIDLPKRSVVVTWQDWNMSGVARTNNGTFNVRLTLNGTQSYDMTNLTAETMSVALKQNGVNATVTFGGMTVSDPGVTIPPMKSGNYKCTDDTLRLQTNERIWQFDKVAG